VSQNKSSKSPSAISFLLIQILFQVFMDQKILIKLEFLS